MKKGELRRRFFVAVMPPSDKVAALDKIQAQGPGDWDWKRPADFHISLAFPGLLDDDEARRLVTVLGQVAHRPFALQFNGMGVFLQKQGKRGGQAPHVLWARPEAAADNDLRALHHKIAAQLRRHRFAFGMKDITPHLTLAKIPARDRSGAANDNLMMDFAAAQAGLQTQTWQCDHFGLYETLPKTHPDHPGNNGGKGSRYVKIAEFKLTG